MYQKTVLRISSQLYPETIGGVGVHVDKLSFALTKRGWKNIVLTVKTDSEPTNETKNGYEIIRVPCQGQPFGNRVAPSIFPKLMELKDRATIIHAHSHLFFLTNVAAFFRRICSLPLVITCHGVWSQSVPMSVQKLYMRTIGLFTLNSADAIICYTEEEKQVLKKLGVKENKMVAIPNGIDASFFRPASNYKSTNILLWVGRFVKGKRPDILIKAMVKIREKIPDASLRMLGSGPLKSYCRRLASEHGLSGVVEFLSFVSDEELLELYRQSSVVLLTSEQEGVPRTILEALSCEVPVVVSDLPQIMPVVDGCGFCFRVGDVDDLVEKTVELLLSSELCREFGENGRRRVCENYLWNTFVEKNLQLYESLVSAG